MNRTEPRIFPSPPSLIKSLLAGFDAISNHYELILFSLGLDLLLWLGPRLKLEGLIQGLLKQTASLPELQTPEMAQILEANREAWEAMASRLNLFSVLRSFPVGIPSLMSSRLPLEGPLGTPGAVEVPSWGLLIGLWLGLSLAGLVAGTLLFGSIAQAALDGRVTWGVLLKRWPWASVQVLLLAIFWIVLLIGLSLPFYCVFSIVLLTGLPLSWVVLLIYGALVLWFFMPLIFSPHGIFINGSTMFTSVRESIRLTRLTLPTTTLFLLTALLLSEGLDVLWEIPPESSWLTLVGVAGHAFITTSLLAASFIYYRDMTRWIQKMLQQAKFTAMQS